MNCHIGIDLFASLVVDQESMERYAEEERQIRQENVRLQRKLQMEIERREQMCRRLSESESSIEMDEERSVTAAQLNSYLNFSTLPVQLLTILWTGD